MGRICKGSILLVYSLLAAGQARAASPLFARGYAVLPQPQTVELAPSDFDFGNGWSLSLDSSVSASDVSVETLREQLRERFAIGFIENSTRTVHLAIKPGSVQVGPALDRDKAELARQAYRLELSPTGIRIIANAGPGLFYGASTLVQLVKSRGSTYQLPAGRITDWPDLQLRQIYWDDAHHLDRLPTLKAALRQAAGFKINGFALKLEGHFHFASAPAVVEPYALSPAELQELTDYGLRYHVQLIPYLDGPAHIAFILKHPEYAKFRSFPNSNYELCAVNSGAIDLLRGMFHDLFAANQGVRYVYLSTDEAYYIGLADSAACQEKSAGTPSRLFSAFVSKFAEDFRAQGRTTIFWGEYPLKAIDIPRLPPHVINGETYGPAFDSEYAKRGIRQLVYTSTQGEEDLFPNYFILPPSQQLHPGRPVVPRVEESMRAIAASPAREQSTIMGMINAGWADRGLHPETFWLGYATATAAGWNPAAMDAPAAREAFYTQFYGPEQVRMDRVYQLMSLQAQTWTDTWDTASSSARKPIWGNSSQIFPTPRPVKDQTLPLPLPDSQMETRRAALAEKAVVDNDELFGLLAENLRRVSLNRYNLEVFVSIAQIYRHNLKLIGDLHRISQEMAGGPVDAKTRDHTLALLTALRDDRNRAMQNATEVWQRSWFPRVPAATGRTFLHEQDDVKDHLPDRTIGMEYLVYRELLLPVNDWVQRRLGAESTLFDWNDLKAGTDRIR